MAKTKSKKENELVDKFEFDVFISHATEDKEDFVRPLAQALIDGKLRVWYDELTLDVGDSLRESIDKGLAKSRFGIVVLSTSFFAKQWTQYELNGLVARQNTNAQKLIIPIWHNISQEEILEKSPSMVDIVALNSNSDIAYISGRIIRKIKTALSTNQQDLQEVEPNRNDSEEIDTKESSKRLKKLMTEEDIDTQVKNKVDLIKELETYLPEERHKIKLFRLINTQTERLYSSLQEDFLTLMLSAPTSELIKERVFAYDLLCEDTLALLINGCYWSHPEQSKLWTASIQRIANAKSASSGYVHIVNLQYYPAMLLLYGAGMAAIASGNYPLLNSLWTEPTIFKNEDEKTSIISKAYPFGVIDRDVINEALGKKFYTPISDHLFELLRPEFSIFTPEDAQFSELFDLYEYMFGLQFAYLRIQQKKHFWAPPGRFKWKYKWEPEEGPSGFIEEQIRSQQANWAPLKAGLFGGSLPSLKETKENYDELLKTISWF